MVDPDYLPLYGPGRAEGLQRGVLHATDCHKQGHDAVSGHPVDPGPSIKRTLVQPGPEVEKVTLHRYREKRTQTCFVHCKEGCIMPWNLILEAK